MTDGYEPGRQARRDILREVYRREKAGERWPTLRELGGLLGLSHTAVRHHVDILQTLGLLERHGYKLGLTDCARAALDVETGG